MKFKTTTKAIKAGTPSNFLRCAGYCDLSNIFRNHSAVAYTAGVYGWNYDVYEIGGKTFCTGYRGMPGQRANNIGKYEQAAAAIWSDYSKSYEERAAEVEKLCAEFVAQA